MSLCQALAHEFTTSTRSRGDRYAEAGAVRIVSRSPTAVEAIVQGTMPYRVSITRVNESRRVRFDVGCECPYFNQEGQLCKHLWALLRTADRSHDLPDQAGGPILQPEAAYIRHADTDEVIDHPLDVDEVDEVDDFDDQDHGVGAPMFRLGHGRVHAVHRTTPHGTATRFLSAVNQRLNASELTPAPSYRYAAGELLYVFDVQTTMAQRGVSLHLMWRQPKKTGGWGKPKTAKIGALDAAIAPDADRRILAMLVGAAPSHDAWSPYLVAAEQHGSFILAEALVVDLIPVIVATGRAWLRPGLDSGDLSPLLWDDGPAWMFRLDVTRTATGARVAGVFERPGEQLTVHEPALILSAGFLFTAVSVARMDPGADFGVIAELRATREVIDVPARDLPALAQTIARASLPTDGLPDDLRVETIDVMPTPCLRLSPLSGSAYDQRVRGDLSFDYDGTLIPPGGPPSIFDAPRRRLIRRRMTAETAAANRVFALGARTGWDAYERQARIEIGPREFSPIVMALVAEGWRVEGEGRRYRIGGAVRLSVVSGIDWFDLDATVAFGDQTLALSDVLAALTRGATTITLGDGSTGVLPDAWLNRYLPLAAAAESVDGRLRFTQPQAALLDALLADAGTGATVDFDEGFRRAREELTRIEQVAAVDPPASFMGTLRDYQREGLGWLEFLQRVGWGGCLADDMGLGKTVMVLALLDARRAQRAQPPKRDQHARRVIGAAGGAEIRPSLIVVPRSLVPNWIAEATRFTPELRVLDYSGTNRRGAAPDLSGYDIVLITYGTLRRDAIRLKDVTFDYVILDEAQAIKNAATVSAKSARLLRGRHRLALTGTPIENHLGELWSLFEFLNPGLLGGSGLFQRATTKPDAATTNLLARGLRPFILRRTKAQVASELPARTEQTISCELSARERTLYDGLRRHYRESILDRVDRVGLKNSQMHILEALLRLRQASCHSGLVDKDRIGESSAKLDVLVPRLTELAEEGHKALVFSQFTSLLAIVRRQIDVQGLTYEYLDGRTKDRGSRVERFQTDPDCRLFLISLKAGGLGLNLTAAEYVFLLDPWWNPAVEAQAIDRAHRIGQTRHVFAYRLIAQNTVEEKILELQRTKRDLADAILSAGTASLRHLQREDLDLLFS